MDRSCGASFQCGRVILICCWWIRKKVFAGSPTRTEPKKVSRTKIKSPTILEKEIRWGPNDCEDYQFNFNANWNCRGSYAAVGTPALL